MRLLLSAGADVDAKDADGRTTLYVLALENRLPMVRFLLEHGRPHVESQDTEVSHSQYLQIRYRYTDIVKLKTEETIVKFNAKHPRRTGI